MADRMWVALNDLWRIPTNFPSCILPISLCRNVALCNNCTNWLRNSHECADLGKLLHGYGYLLRKNIEPALHIIDFNYQQQPDERHQVLRGTAVHPIGFGWVFNCFVVAMLARCECHFHRQTVHLCVDIAHNNCGYILLSFLLICQ